MESNVSEIDTRIDFELEMSVETDNPLPVHPADYHEMDSAV
ncbi:MAG: hypothetical protein AB7J32_13880 [Pseudonocardia sp.]